MGFRVNLYTTIVPRRTANGVHALSIIALAYSTGVRGVTYGTMEQDLRVRTYQRSAGDGKRAAEVVSGPGEPRHAGLALGDSEHEALAYLERIIRRVGGEAPIV